MSTIYNLKILLTFETNIPLRPENCVQLLCAMECFQKNLLSSNLLKKFNIKKYTLRSY